MTLDSIDRDTKLTFYVLGLLSDLQDKDLVEGSHRLTQEGKVLYAELIESGFAEEVTQAEIEATIVALIADSIDPLLN